MKIFKEAYRIFLLIVAFALTVFVFFYDVVAASRADGWTVLFGILGFLLSSCLAVFFHEAGHLLFGICFGMRPVRVQIGPFVFDRNKKGVALRNFEPFGSCDFYPVRTDRLSLRYAMTVAGGLIFSLAFVLLSALFYLRGGAMHYVFGMGLPVSVFLFFYNAAPLSLPSGDTDGRLLADILAKTPETIVTLHVLAIQGGLLSRSPASLSEDLYFDVPVVAEDERGFIALTRLRYLYFLDKGERAGALAQSMRLRELLVYLSEGDLEEIYSQLLYDCCALERNEDGAAALFDRQEEYLLSQKSATAYRILAAYHATYGEKERAEEYVRSARSALANEPLAGIAKMEEKLLNETNA